MVCGIGYRFIMEYIIKKHRSLLSFIFFIVNSFAVNSQSLTLVQKSFEINNNQYAINLPEGFSLELLNDEMDGPRLFSFDKSGVLFIGSKSGNIYRLEPPYTAPTVFTLMDNYPHSIAFKDQYIYISETDVVKRARYNSQIKSIAAEEFEIVVKLPGGAGHNSRTIANGPDNRLYISLGITGNCSNEFMSEQYSFQNRRGGIYLLDESVKPARLKVFSSGLRNPVGFDWHPQSQVMFASNNGPDHHGFENPPEYFSEIKENSFHGMPWYQFDGNKMFRDECIKSKPPFTIDKVQRPVAMFPPRNAPMGVSFIPEYSMLNNIKYSAVVALRGSWATKPSWNYKTAAASRRKPKLVVVNFNDKNQAVNVTDLLTGFQLNNGNRWARPVGVGTGPDGALYFTSDSGVNGLFRLKKTK